MIATGAAQPRYTRAPYGECIGTSWNSVSVYATYSDLVHLFGEPEEGDGYKVAFQWVLRDVNGHILTIYDWKETNLYDPDLASPDQLKRFPNPGVEWHIGTKVAGPDRALAEWIGNHMSDGRRIVE